MDELTGNEEPQEKISRIRQIISFSVSMFFILSISRISNYFEGQINFYIFTFLWFLLYFNIQFFLNKKKGQPFEFKNWLKDTGYYVLALLIGYNLISLTVSASESVPEGISTYFPVILIVAAIVFLIGYGLHFVEKYSKM